MGGSAFVEQVQMLRARATGAVSSGRGNPRARRATPTKRRILVGGEIVHAGIRADGGVEGANAEQFFDGQVVHQARVHGRDQLGHSGEPAANQLRARRCDEVSHFWMAACVVRALDEDDARLASRVASSNSRCAGERPSASSPPYWLPSKAR